MSQITATETQNALAKMFTENTGSHFLDSGGAYGRNWERNQDKTVETFINSPNVVLDKYGVTISAFHYLDAFLEYDSDMDNEFQEWLDDPIRKDDSYFECVYNWCNNFENSYMPSFNSYNEETLLSQGFQIDTFMIDNDDYCCLSIHGGCDIRGGYTRPKVFRIFDGFGGRMNDFTIYSKDREKEDIVLDYSYGEIIEAESGEYISKDSELAKWLDFWSEGEGCPKWDEEKEMWKAPDNDGYIGVDVFLGY
jgi:hypothetical protein